MRETARSIQPIENKPIYPDNMAEYAKSIDTEREIAEATKMNRKIIFGGEFISLSLTIDQYHDDFKKECWHLSTGWLCRQGVAKIPDKLAEILCVVFFDNEHKEIPCEGKIIPTIRHFISPV